MTTTSRGGEILDAALAVFAERGYRGASLDAIAERAGLTRQGLLHYFPSKKRLLMAAIELREELNREHLAEAGYTGRDLPSILAEVVAYDHSNAGLAQVYSILLAESLVGEAPAKEFFLEYYQTVLAGMVEEFTLRYGERLPSGLTPHAAATALLAMLNGMQQHWLVDREQTDHPTIMRDVMSVLLGSTPG